VASVNDGLLALADHDESIVRARHDVEHPGSMGDLDAAGSELASVAAQARSLDEERVPLAARAEALDRDATAARDRASVIAKRLDEATGAGRELEAMAHERDAIVARAELLDDELLGVYELLEPLDERLEALRATAVDAAARRERAQESVNEERDAASARLVELVDSRQPLAEALDPATLARYEAAATLAGGIGAARLVNGRCGGCHVAVPAAIADRLAHGPEGSIAVCDECGRLLTR
jgi:predicted  nucleic acid-binding Zn-ribbon protein